MDERPGADSTGPFYNARVSHQKPGPAARVGRVAGLAALAALLVVVGFAAVGAAYGPVLPAATIAAPEPGPASTRPAVPGRRVVIDPATKQLVVGDWLTGTMPAAPFGYGDPTSTNGLFAEATLGAVTDDAGWVRDENMPVALIAAAMEPRAVVVHDLGESGRGVVAELGRRLFRSLRDLTVTDIRSNDPFTIGDHRAQWSHARVSGLLSDGRADSTDVSLLLVALPDGRCFGFVQVRPDRDDARQHFEALDEAANSIVAVG